MSSENFDSSICIFLSCANLSLQRSIKSLAAMNSLVQAGKRVLAIRRGVEYPKETLTPALVKILTWFAIWTDSNHFESASVAYKVFLFINHLNFGFFILSMVFGLFAPKDSWLVLADDFCHVFAITGAYLKAEILHVQRKSLTEIFTKITQKDEKLQEKGRLDKKINYMRGQSYWNELSLVILFIFFDGCAVAMAISYIIAMPQKQLPFPAVYPFSIEDQGFGFWVACLSQIWGTIFLSINYLLMDASIGSCYNQIALHFRVLGREIKRLKEVTDREKRKMRLFEIVQDHEQLYRYVELKSLRGN